MTLNAKTCSNAQRVLSQTVRNVTHARHDPPNSLNSLFAPYATLSTGTIAKPETGPPTSTNTPPTRRPLGREAKQKEADREFFADLLSSAATKRDAKAYISRLKLPAKTTSTTPHPPISKPVVNLGNLFPGNQAAFRNPTFTQSTPVEEGFDEEETLHVALVKINDVHHLPENILLGIGETLSQLNRLSISPCVFVEATGSAGENWKQEIGEQVDRLVAAIGYMNDGAARRVDNVFVTSRSRPARVANRKLLLRPLRRGQVPVVSPFAYKEDEQRLEQIGAKDAIIALSKEFAGLNIQPATDDAEQQSIAAIQVTQQQISLDRIITIDSAGGTSNPFAPEGRDVFINLEQEYDTLCERLSNNSSIDSPQQLSNLDILQQSLQFLPPTSSGLMTTHVEAANPGRVADESASSVGTRRQKNALIHNLLTDKPAYSSSLPAGRLSKQNPTATPVSTSSFVKRGMPLTILPDPQEQSWTPNRQRIKLTDPRIDLARLVHLIEDSFNRKLDVEHYLNRVNDRIAGVIIAGEYEGGALLTWEDPVGMSDENTSQVPYLDKFAVLKRSQGAGGVADVVFNAMVRTCFPNGVCWRSRKDNPVNKWYFERSRGTWKIPDMNWTMFWTTPGVEVENKLFREYETVCRGVLPSWADQKAAD